MPEKRNKIGNDESAGGPDDQERWQKAESLHEPDHLGQIFQKTPSHCVSAVRTTYENRV